MKPVLQNLGVIDLHCDTISRLHGSGEPCHLMKNEFQVDIGKLKEGGVAAQFFAVFIPTAKTENPLAVGLDMIDRFYRELEMHSSYIAFAGSASDLIRNSCEGRISAFLTLEDSGIIGGSLSALRMMHRLGVRLITLTWNYRNQVGYPNTDTASSGEGLTEHGRAFVSEMERLGMIIDVSHLSDAGFCDVSRIVKGPFVASHSNARTVTSHPRNLTDDMIRTIADHGGVIGINLYGLFVEPNAADIEHVVSHVKHIIKVGGIECAALGTDFDGIDQNTAGLENSARLPALFNALEKAGLSAGDIDRIRFQNAFRVIDEVCG